ncbi:hypothetical protein CDAR_187911 [Caerostris darwini]|uniref:Uncharacterized protein n=1 Tax=Caerostris darwini TaxID=1538125 RepID=A0AAV4SQP3_9ARAC|nr:hypothetical protein CDAR_187911 [Caerostris darwini]
MYRWEGWMPSAIDAKFPSFQVQGVKILRGRSVLGPDPNRRSGPLSSKWSIHLRGRDPVIYLNLFRKLFQDRFAQFLFGTLTNISKGSWHTLYSNRFGPLV